MLNKLNLDENSIPTVIGYSTGQYQVEIDCPYCKKTHLHGKAGMESGDLGHRGSHCKDNSNNNGYHIHLPEKQRAL